MSNRLLLVRDITDEASWEHHEFEGSVCAELQRRYAAYPAGARLYHEHVSEATEVTPTNPAELAALERLEGDFVLVQYPEGPAAPFIAVFVAALAVAIAFQPKIPNVAMRNVIASSPNNQLSSRVNNARPNGRIPDIFGTVRSTPDLVALPYSRFVNNTEIENAVMCIGRGSHTVHDARDGETPVSEIAQASVEVYRPNTNIASGSPHYSVGAPIDEAPLNVLRSNSVNGQTLKPENLDSYIGDRDVWFHSDGRIHLTGTDSVEDQFAVGDVITVSGAQRLPPPRQFTGPGAVLIQPHEPDSFITDFSFPLDGAGRIDIGWDPERPAIFGGQDEFSPSIYLTGEVTYASHDTVVASMRGEPQTTHNRVRFTAPANAQWANVTPETWWGNPTDVVINYSTPLYNLDGEYTVTQVYGNMLVVTPNSEWAKLPPEGSGYLSPTVGKTADVLIGPFYLDLPGGSLVMANLVAGNGLYKDDGRNQSPASVTIALTVTRVDAANNPTSAPVTQEFTLVGSGNSRDQVALTAELYQPTPGRVSVSARRTSLTDRAFEGQVVDEVKWRDLYHAAPLANPDFGNVTMVRSRTVATTAALSVKERKLNLLVTRDVPLRVADDEFTTTLHPTNDAAEIFCAVCHDPMIGNRPAADIDYDNIYDTVAAIQAYFGTADAAEFCYTIDKPEMTFEETLACIAQAVFSIAHRRGSVIRLAFERSTPDSTILFNHRNKLPGSETRTVRFGYENNHDGVEYKWVNPEDDAIETLTLGTAPVNPRKIESVGVRNYNQAYWHAHRAWNKLRYQNTTVEFSATSEADLAVLSDRILVADNTRSETQDGEVVAMDGLDITTSQPLQFEPGHDYTIFLQLYDGSVEALPITPHPTDPRRVTLAGAPALPLVLGLDMYARTRYQIVDDAEPDRRAFLLTERASESSNTARITAINYDPRYYANDPLDPVPPPVLYNLVTEGADQLVASAGVPIHTGA